MSDGSDSKPGPAVFLDRDGTINVDVPYVGDPDEIKLLPNAVAGLCRLRDMGFALVIVTNQSGIGRGYFTEEDFHQVQSRLFELFEPSGISFLDAFFCPFHPEAKLPEYRRVSEDRKPSPGMLLKAAAKHGLDRDRSFMIGNSETDIEAGQKAGCRTIRLCESKAETKADFIAADLLEASRIIEANT
ncbi:MAG: HAD family hydrolase [Planctomycetota bacterium]|jgi:D-glycero-D-manno-heptose 1,7-bisphosphate phosphatase|nr:HAD family hydrolase [Planctomycetota bacterium]MDP7134537.1 HAD family hydrolase [Planctomycetota bacterium]